MYVKNKYKREGVGERKRTIRSENEVLRGVRNFFELFIIVERKRKINKNVFGFWSRVLFI